MAVFLPSPVEELLVGIFEQDSEPSHESGGQTCKICPQPGIESCAYCQKNICERHTRTYTTTDAQQILLCPVCHMRASRHRSQPPSDEGEDK